MWTLRPDLHLAIDDGISHCRGDQISAHPWRRAELGAMNGHGNARAIATVQSILANGGVKGTRLLSEQGRCKVLEEQANSVDLVLGVPLRWGLGYCLNAPVPTNQLHLKRALGRNQAFWAGNGGSMSYVDLDARMMGDFYSPVHLSEYRVGELLGGGIVRGCAEGYR